MKNLIKIHKEALNLLENNKNITAEDLNLILKHINLNKLKKTPFIFFEDINENTLNDIKNHLGTIRNKLPGVYI